MRLTPEIMSRSQSHLNAIKERELELRGLQIPLIENIASHQGSFDTLNLDDNRLLALGNIPLSPRIRTIHVAQNNISSIASNLSTTVPHLETLNLAQNSLASLSSLLPLSSLNMLVHLSLVGNPICGEEYYRSFVIWKIPSLRTLDYKRIKDAERTESLSLFVDAETSLPTKLALSLLSESNGGLSKTNGSSASASLTANGKSVEGGKGRLMTADDKQKVKELIGAASSVEEIKKLERALGEGRMPDDL